MKPIGESIGKLRERWVASGKMVDVHGTEADLAQAPDDGLSYCEMCKGWRFVRRGDLERGDPELGKSIPCPACRSLVIAARIKRLSGELPPLFKTWTFYSFPAEAASDEQIGLLSRLRQWPEAWVGDAEDGWAPWLYLFGRSARGKTGMGIACLKACMEKGCSGMFRDVSAMLETLRESYGSRQGFDNSDSARAEWELLRGVDVLMLDDIGAERHRRDEPVDWATEKLFQLIGWRHDRKLRTILTSNLGLDDLAELLGHVRLPSRVLEMSNGDEWAIEVEGNNLRTRPRAAF